MRSSSTHSSRALLVWAVLLVAALVVTVSAASGQAWLKSNVFELLPDSRHDPLTEAATRMVDAELGTRLLFFIGHHDRAVAKSVADRFGKQLLESPLVASVTTRIDETQFAAMATFYFSHRSQILSFRQLERIAGDASGVEREALAQVFSPFGAGGGTLATDPFFLFPGSLQALQPASTALNIDDAYLWATRDNRDYIFTMAMVTSPTLSIIEQQGLAQHINAAIEEAVVREPGLDFLKTGFSFYAHEATQSAKGEISTIGVGSLIGLLLLVVSTFRSLRPLSLIVVSILAGCLVALAVTLSVFGFVHLFTLVFGASLIGVSVDYSFHYVADDAFGGEDWTPRTGLRNIFMGITLGLLTSILAYMALTVAPFPGLQQLAVFSSAGLVGAYFTLICMCRLWRRRFVLHENSIILRFTRWYLSAWQKLHTRGRIILLAALLLTMALSYHGIDIDDDVKVLQSQPVELVRQEAAIQELLGVAQAGTFLLSSAASDEQLLQLEERLRTDLEQMISSGKLGSYQAVSRWVPSIAQQTRSQQAYAGLLRSHLPGYFESLGVADDVLSNTLDSLTTEATFLEVVTWKEHPVSEQFRNLWLDTAGADSASIILLFGVRDVDAVAAIVADFPTVKVVNKGRELSLLFGEYRTRVAQVLAVAYLIILAGLSTRYGPLRAAVLLIPPVLAGLLALIVISLAGETLNLFNFLAMILVLGIGIDFTLFVAEARKELTSTMFAITLSALTTMLSFGLLSLSSTYAVHSFGLTVLIGITCAYLLSPLATSVRSKPLKT